jgi:hypothetical protein
MINQQITKKNKVKIKICVAVCFVLAMGVFTAHYFTLNASAISVAQYWK